MTPPCGIPFRGIVITPFSNTPAFNHLKTKDLPLEYRTLSNSFIKNS
jgi:hypothetical protein